MAIFPISQRPECIEEISDWHYQEWRHLYPSLTRDDFRRDIQDSLESGLIPGTWVLEKDGQIIGTASLQADIIESRSVKSPWLSNVYIREDYRGQGLGRSMVQQVLEQLAGSGLEQLLLYTEDQPDFYAALGWELVSTESYQDKQLHLMRYRFTAD